MREPFLCPSPSGDPNMNTDDAAVHQAQAPDLLGHGEHIRCTALQVQAEHSRLLDVDPVEDALAESTQQNQLDTIALRVQLIRMEANMSDKISADDVDPSLIALNEQIGVAREQAKKAAAAAADSWSTLQAGAADALAALRSSAEEAAVRVEQEMKG